MNNCLVGCAEATYCSVVISKNKPITENILRILTSVFLFILVLTSGMSAQEADSPAPFAISEIYLAKDDGTGNAGEPAVGFVISDVPIYCVVRLTSTAAATLKMDLIAVSVPGVKPGTRVVSASYTTKDNEDRVNFSGRPHGQWIAGSYRVDIYIGNLLAGRRELLVYARKPTQKPASESAIKQKLATKPKTARQVSKNP